MSDERIGQFLEGYDFDYFINKALEKVPEGIDKREGSIIYDALAPACYQLASFIFDLKNILLETFVQTASGQYLDYRAEETGLERIPATNAIVRAKFTGQNESPFSLAIGSRFSSVGDNPIYYQVILEESPGMYRMKAEQSGTQGNKYIGTLLPLDNFNGLVGATLTNVLIPARDTESDDELRVRILNAREVVSFGGNINDYIDLTMGIDGVGAVQVYPIWQGGGTVKLVILDNSFNGASSELVEKVQGIIDPKKEGLGIGYAPIGHTVTVASPSNKQIDIGFTLTLSSGIMLEQVRSNVEKVIREHFLSVRKKWANRVENQYDCWIFRSQITAAILTVPGVANVQSLTLNGQQNDIKMRADNEKQELPILGTVSIS